MSEGHKEMNLSPAMEKVWNDLVTKVESDPGFWSKPWFIDPITKKITRPYNPVTKRNYNGYNVIHLEFTRLARGYRHNQWLTFNQAKSIGGFVNKGEKGTPIIVFNPPQYKVEPDPDTKEDKKITVRNGFFSYAIVFNVDQTSIKPEELPVEVRKNYTIPEVEAMILKSGAKVIHSNEDKAAYSPGRDMIVLPEPHFFKSQAGYYGVKFHELIHWTGHESRLNRLSKCAGFGSDSYSREELVAEIGSVFLKSETGINDGIDNAAAYVKNWWQRIKEDKGSLMTAAGQADKAAKFIINFKEA